jgi:hypothetical protein
VLEKFRKKLLHGVQEQQVKSGRKAARKMRAR